MTLLEARTAVEWCIDVCRHRKLDADFSGSRAMQDMRQLLDWLDDAEEPAHWVDPTIAEQLTGDVAHVHRWVGIEGVKGRFCLGCDAQE